MTVFSSAPRLSILASPQPGLGASVSDNVVRLAGSSSPGKPETETVRCWCCVVREVYHHHHHHHHHLYHSNIIYQTVALFYILPSTLECCIILFSKVHRCIFTKQEPYDKIMTIAM